MRATPLAPVQPCTDADGAPVEVGTKLISRCLPGLDPSLKVIEVGERIRCRWIDTDETESFSREGLRTSHWRVWKAGAA